MAANQQQLQQWELLRFEWQKNGDEPQLGYVRVIFTENVDPRSTSPLMNLQVNPKDTKMISNHGAD